MNKNDVKQFLCAATVVPFNYLFDILKRLNNDI